MHVIATAGHVDHGKSTLVRGLTGMETDRWAEERRRGLTIDLGFAWTSGGAGEPIAFVDVPGHERFVPNMLAGIGPVPAVLFVVAADEGWMPQSEEHLCALHALGVRHGVLAITHADLADPAPTLEQATERIEATSLGVVPTVVVSGATGDGLDELRAELEALVAQLPEPDVTDDVRLWVDRSFTIGGAGTVVTGTLPAGKLRVGDELVLASTGQRLHVRGLQSLGQEATSAAAVARIAVNLKGSDRDAVQRGNALITPEAWPTTGTIDVVLGPSDVPAGELLTEPIMHVGAAAKAVRLRSLGNHHARLNLPQPLPLRVGDRLLLRDPGQHRIVAGATVLDVKPPRLFRRGDARVRAAALAAVSRGASGSVSGGATPAATRAHLAHRGAVTEGELRVMGLPPAGAAHSGWRVDQDQWTRWVTELRSHVESWCVEHPLQPGPPANAVMWQLGLPAKPLLEALTTEAGLALEEGRIRQPEASRELPAPVTEAVQDVTDQLRQQPFVAPDADRLAELGLGTRELAAAVRTGVLHKVADGIVLLPGAERHAAEVLRDLPEPFTLSQARRALGTTRRVAVPLLESMDRAGLTVRLPDNTRRLR